MNISTMRYPTNIKYGAGAVSLLPELLKEAKKNRPFLVTDKNLVEKDFLQDLITLLKDHNVNYHLYSQAQGNPTISQVTLGVENFKKHQADSLILIGGGCALDVGKAIGLLETHEGSLDLYEDGLETALPIQDNIPWTVALPTTAGTGSEVGGSAVISDDKTHRKIIVWSPYMVPDFAILDPNLSKGLPFGVTAATGFDALTHNMEAFLAKGYHPLADGIALEGMRLVKEHLLLACYEPQNTKARGGMLLASAMGATAFQKGLGVTHSCSHALSTCYDLHHGFANAMMLLPCMQFNYKEVPHKFIRMANAVDIFGKEDEIVEQFFGWIAELKSKLDFPTHLSKNSVKLTKRLIGVAYEDPCHINNPRMCNKQDFEQLFSEAIAT